MIIHINTLSHLLEEIPCLQATLGCDRLSLDDLRRRRLPLGVVRGRLELRVVLLERVAIRLQLLHRLLVRALPLTRLRELVLQVRDRVRLLLQRPHPPLHQLHLLPHLLDRLVLDPDRPRKHLHLVDELRGLALRLDVDRCGRLDVVDAEDPRRRTRDWTETTVSVAFALKHRAASWVVDVAPRDLLLVIGMRLGGRRLICRSLFVDDASSVRSSRSGGVRLRRKPSPASGTHGAQCDFGSIARRGRADGVETGSADSVSATPSTSKVRR